jgi:hypothetical protein
LIANIQDIILKKKLFTGYVLVGQLFEPAPTLSEIMRRRNLSIGFTIVGCCFDAKWIAILPVQWFCANSQDWLDKIQSLLTRSFNMVQLPQFSRDLRWADNPRTDQNVENGVIKFFTCSKFKRLSEKHGVR